MESAAGPSHLAKVIRDDLEGLLDRWMEKLCSKSWSLREAVRKHHKDAKTPSTVVDQLCQRCRNFLVSLENALSGASVLEMGSAEFREAVQSLSFSAGWMAGVGLPITDAIMLVYTLKDSLDWDNESFFQALMVVVTEAHSASQMQKAQSKHRDVMEKSQFVCNLHWRLPMLVLVGDPDRHALDDAVGRVMMLAVMREARAVVIDISTLIHPEVTGRQALEILNDHSNSARVEVHLCGISPVLQRELQSKLADRVFLYDELPKALSQAAKVNDLSWPIDR